MTMLSIADVSWGDAPPWIAAITSVVALFFAFRAARFTVKTLHLELGRDRERAEVDAREQASRIFASPSRTTGTGGYDAHHYVVPAVIICNRSDLPIYDVFLDSPRYQLSGEPPRGRVVDGRYYLGIAPPGDTPIEIGYCEIKDALVTDELINHVNAGIALDDWDEDVDAVLREWEARGRPSITFRDANNRIWTRRPNGLFDAGEPAHLPAPG